MENHHAINGEIHYKWAIFNSFLYVHQRVYIIGSLMFGSPVRLIRSSRAGLLPWFPHGPQDHDWMIDDFDMNGPWEVFLDWVYHTQRIHVWNIYLH